MTALEAYALAKKIAKSAVSGIKSLTVSGTTLYIETNDGNIITMVFPVPADGRGITSAAIDSNGHLILTYDDGTTQDAGLIPGADVNVTQILSTGTKIAEIEANGITTELFAPAGGGSCDLSVIADDFDDTKSYAVNEKVIYEDKLYRFIVAHAAGPWDSTEVEVVNVVTLIDEKPTLIRISEADYNALSYAEKHDLTKVYFLYDAGGGGGGSDDYNDLNNKPQINSVTLMGNKSFDDLGMSELDPSQLNDLLDII